MLNAKSIRREKVKRRVRKKVYGTASSPRLSVFRSNSHIYGQLIDDDKGVTLCAFSSKNADVEASKGTKSEKAFQVGKALGETAVANGITSVVFDRNGYLYHGRVKNLAEGAREGGLKF
jgi:large subunit ribosomal protein L18